jgi:hypothetical protein
MTVLVIPPGTTEIKASVYENGVMTEVVIPGSVNTIKWCAFYGCTNLQTITIPASVVEIRERAFQGCMNLQRLIISASVTVIEEYTFQGCFKLHSLEIPGSVTTIEWCSFQGCSGLQFLIIPASVTEIGSCAFHMCSSLETLIIPAGVIEIGDCAFYGCSNLQRIWNKSKCELDNCKPWVYIRGETPPLKDLERWTVALHWHWRYPDRITPKQARLFTLGFHCLAMPTELCQTVFSYIPRA